MVENMIVRYSYILMLIALCLGTNKLMGQETVGRQKVKLSGDAGFDPQDHSIIFRRTTLIVRDVKKSLALYQNAMGMKIIYDKILKRPHPIKDGEEQEVRLVFLKAVDEYYGVLGLMEYQYGEENKIIEPVRKEGFAVQNSVMLFNTNDLDTKFPIIKSTAGVEVFAPPTLREYPSYDGNSVIRVMVSIFYDPDGFLVEFNELLDTIKTK